MKRPAPQGAPESAGRILVVDDSVVIRRLLCRTLSFFAYQVVEASDGWDALTVLERDPAFDLLITDLQMPGMDGYTLVQRIRSNAALSAFPILVLTGENIDASSGPPTGTQGLISKPFSPPQLLASVRQLIAAAH